MEIEKNLFSQYHKSKLLVLILFIAIIDLSQAQIESSGTKLIGDPKVLTENFYGFNTKNLDGNFVEDPNILEAWKKTKAKIYRYPGGTFGNSFNWHIGKGAVGSRVELKMKTPITPADVSTQLPTDTDILWMANVRFPLPEAVIDWNSILTTSEIDEYRDEQLDWTGLTRAQLLCDDVVTIKANDIIAGLDAFAAAGKEVKYLEFGNEFYFSDDEGQGEKHGAFFSDKIGDFQGDHFPYDDNPTTYLNQMGVIAEAVKVEYPNIKIGIIMWKKEAGGAADWNDPIMTIFNDPASKASIWIDAVVYHWYQPANWYEKLTLPTITDAASSKNAIGLAYDYIQHKIDNETQNSPAGKEIWITEGDLWDESTEILDVDGETLEHLWLEGIREAIVQVNYILLDNVTMHTPHLFQPDYYDTDKLILTSKGKGASMVYAAAEDMTSVQKIDLGGHNFKSDHGVAYQKLQAVKYSNVAGEERYILINCSNTEFSDIDLSSIITAPNLMAFTRAKSDPWASGSPSETISSFDSSNISLGKYSIMLLAEEDLLKSITQSEFVITDNDATYPERAILAYDFGANPLNSVETKTLTITNNGTTDVTLINDPVSFTTGTVFSLVSQPSNLTIAEGGAVSFTIQYAPTTESSFTDTLSIESVTGEIITLPIQGAIGDDCLEGYFCNGDFENGINSQITEGSAGDATITYSAADLADTYGDTGISGKLAVTALESAGYYDARLVTDLITVEAATPTDHMLSVDIYAKADDIGENSGFRIAVRFYDNTNTEIVGSLVQSSSLALTTTYTKQGFTTTAMPIGTVKYMIELRCGNYVDNYYFDALTIVEETVLDVTSFDPTTDPTLIYYFENTLYLETSSHIDKRLTIVLYNILGQIVMTSHYKNTGNMKSIKLNIPNGIYILSLRSQNTILKQQKILSY